MFRSEVTSVGIQGALMHAQAVAAQAQLQEAAEKQGDSAVAPQAANGSGSTMADPWKAAWRAKREAAAHQGGTGSGCKGCS